MIMLKMDHCSSAFVVGLVVVVVRVGNGLRVVVVGHLAIGVGFVVNRQRNGFGV